MRRGRRGETLFGGKAHRFVVCEVDDPAPPAGIEKGSPRIHFPDLDVGSPENALSPIQVKA